MKYFSMSKLTKLSILLIACSVLVGVVSLFVLPATIAVQWEHFWGGAVRNTMPKYLGVLVGPAVTALGAYLLRAKNQPVYILMCVLGLAVAAALLVLNL